MESFYSIIYYRPNSLTDELLAVGVLASGGEGPFIHVSRRRLDLLKKILHPAQFTAVKRHFNALSKAVKDDQTDSNELLLFDPNYSKERLEELSKRTKGAVEYSRPVTINEWLNRSFFNELVEHFMGDRVQSSIAKRPVFQLKWKAYYRSNRFKEWRKDVDLENINGVSLPFKADLYDEHNKLIVKGVDFNLSAATVKKRLASLELAMASCKDHTFKIVYPVVRKGSGKELFQSIDSTNQHLTLEKFTEFKKNV